MNPEHFSPKENLRRFRENWQEEVDSAAQYRALAESEPDPKIAKVFQNLAKVEETHIAFWELRLKDAGAKVGSRRPSWRSRVLIFIAEHFDPRLVLSTIAADEQVGRNSYDAQSETRGTGMAAQERWHAKVLSATLKGQSQGMEGSFLARLEGRHRAVGGNALRAAVLGANDGLCTNLSLVMGVAGATTDLTHHALLVTGLAGLLAGAFSMALGEFVSVKSSRELAEREIRIESQELEHDPQGEGEELKLIYEAKGLSPKEAEEMAAHLMTDKSQALDALAREELGIDPSDLGGSPWEAAGVSFLLFSTGALVPVFPFFFVNGATAVSASIALSALALFLIGAAITIFTGRPVWQSGGRQLILGLAAAGATFGLGKWIGHGL